MDFCNVSNKSFHTQQKLIRTIRINFKEFMSKCGRNGQQDLHLLVYDDRKGNNKRKRPHVHLVIFVGDSTLTLIPYHHNCTNKT